MLAASGSGVQTTASFCAHCGGEEEGEGAGRESKRKKEEEEEEGEAKEEEEWEERTDNFLSLPMKDTNSIMRAPPPQGPISKYCHTGIRVST